MNSTGVPDVHHHSRAARLAGAFTLIELLVVIAIIALLVSILVPSLQAARAMGLSVKCMTNLKGAGSGFLMYAEDNNNYLFPKCMPDTYYWYDAKWWNVLSTGYTPPDYLGTGRWKPPAMYVSKDIVYCTVKDALPYEELGGMGHYGMNDPSLTPGVDFVGDWSFSWFRLSAAKAPGELYLLGDSGAYFFRSDYMQFRHMNKLNILWMDGHVKSTGPNGAIMTAWGSWGYRPAYNGISSLVPVGN